LPKGLTAADAGEAHEVRADGKLYVWSGTRFPADGAGSEFRGPAGVVDIHGLGLKATVVDADELVLADSADTFKLKKFSWANLKKALELRLKAMFLNPADSAQHYGTTALPLVDGVNFIGADLTAALAAAGNDRAKVDYASLPVGYSSWRSMKVDLKVDYDTATGTLTNKTLSAPLVTGVVKATGTAVDVDLALAGKGAGKVLANGDPIVTTTAAQTLTNKTLTSPKITNALIETIKDVNNNNILSFYPGSATAKTYVQIYNHDSYAQVSAKSSAADGDLVLQPQGNAGVVGISARGQGYSPPLINGCSSGTVAVTGPDSSHNLNLVSKGPAGKVLADSNPVVTSVAAPATKTAAGKAGQIAYAAGFVYVCVADNKWQRAALADW
jgi:hypothetical protein